MIKIAASLHSGPKINLEKVLQQLAEAKVDFLHIDVMDSNFVNEIEFGKSIVKEISQHSKIPLDIHMMVESPERILKDYALPTTQTIGIHIEATNHIHRILTMIKNLNKKAEVIINPGTAIETIKPVLNLVDQVMIMSVDPGFGGSTFINSSIERVKQLNDLRQKYNYHYQIEVDGSVDNNNLKELIDAGVDIAVSGSFIFKGNIIEQVKKLKSL
ncbi:ribulose-phosphate 3-epimerase [Lactobacillus sp. ESL0791]|uniref:ribulose-phosphate 3-epimerase n=1 Tax=Lactobacillus sp. ESL0791 TaxID=2983234 RepID=UPI0023F81C2B|nr:ribulose-phosphate 3-epimerase [Lactobacillus sp. ESL0791]MDF7639572.1 ribulose-phosphate 3-epimerase [Lactobacillus sp. ESL0791]